MGKQLWDIINILTTCVRFRIILTGCTTNEHRLKNEKCFLVTLQCPQYILILSFSSGDANIYHIQQCCTFYCSYTSYFYIQDKISFQIWTITLRNITSVIIEREPLNRWWPVRMTFCKCVISTETILKIGVGFYF